ncbi:unnamed protein product [Clonostachys solani]|uniref:Ankyrin repeat protein n=1 Tax=Clonostachys solani TaxID=160281 RepID=A0A9P0EMW9_9HYPO|nr:unnamed protein product [Clonostachys solani]
MLSDTTSSRVASDAMETETAFATPAPLRIDATETEANDVAETIDSAEPSGPSTSDGSFAVERGTSLHNILLGMEEGSSDDVQNRELGETLTRLNEQELNQPDGDEQTPLHIAVSRGLLGATKSLLARGVENSIKHKDRTERQPLHYACMSGHKEIVNLLLGFGADLEAQQGDGRTPLGEACYWEHLDVMNELLSHGAKVNVMDNGNRSLLTLAVIDRNIDIVQRLLLEEHLDLNNRENANGWTALHRAAFWGAEEIVDLLLKRGASTSIQDNDGWTPLYAATYGEEATIMKKFLYNHKGDKMNPKELETPSEEGYTPLLAAIERRCANIVSLLLEAGANCNAEDNQGRRALHHATAEGDESIVLLLIKGGADFNAQDKQGRRALHYATTKGHDSIAFLLIRSGADCNAQDKQGRRALHYAAAEGYDSIASLLIEGGADHNAQDEEGRRALHDASAQGNATIVSLLLNYKADCNAEDNEGRRALHDASTQGQSAIVTLLFKNGAMVNPRDKDRKTPLQLAFKADQKHEWDERDGVMRSFLKDNNLNTTALGIDEVKEDVLVWAAKSFNRHDIAVLLMKKSPGLVEPSNSSQWSAIEWATYRNLPQILWLLLANSPQTNDSKRMVKSASEFINKPRRVLKLKEIQKQRAVMDKGDMEVPLEDRMTAGPLDSKRAELVADILQDPPFAQYTDNEQIKIREISHSQSNVSGEFDAAVMQIYRENGKSIVIREPRVVKDVIYGNGPVKIMEDKMKRLRELKRFIQSMYTNKDDEKILQMADITSEPRFTWIHLPSANDLLARIMKDHDCDPTEYRSVRGFLKDSWVEVPDRESSSRMMRPRFIERDPGNASENTTEGNATSKAEAGSMNENSEHDADIVTKGKHQKAFEEDANSDFVAASATYMPYLLFSTQCRQGNGNNDHTAKTACVNCKDSQEKCDSLLGAHPNSAVHTSPTLDEWYYGFTQGDEFSKDKNYRNENQVATRELVGDVNELAHWPLLRVNQLWIWTLDNKWIITAAPDPMDSNSHTFLDGVLERLKKLGQAGESSSQPESTSDMRQLLVDYCIESYERKSAENEFSHFQDQKILKIQRASIRQLFSNSIKKLGRDETILFKQLTKQPSVSKDAGKPRNTIVKHLLNATFGGVEIRKAIKQAEKLSCDVKDIRDELNILKSVAIYQRDVQDRLSAVLKKEVRSNLTAKYVEGDINGMDKVAERIQSAVDTTLALQQGQETVRQGRTLMVFTVVTIIFLPLSFLSSLFALDVASFQETPGWAFAIICGYQLAILSSQTTYAMFSDDFTDLLSKIRETFKGAKEKSIKDVGLAVIRKLTALATFVWNHVSFKWRTDRSGVRARTHGEV